MVAAVAQPPDGEFADRLSKATKRDSSNLDTPSNNNSLQGRDSINQPNAGSKNLDPQQNQTAQANATAVRTQLAASANQAQANRADSQRSLASQQAANQAQKARATNAQVQRTKAANAQATNLANNQAQAAANAPDAAQGAAQTRVNTAAVVADAQARQSDALNLASQATQAQLDQSVAQSDQIGQSPTVSQTAQAAEPNVPLLGQLSQAVSSNDPASSESTPNSAKSKTDDTNLAAFELIASTVMAQLTLVTPLAPVASSTAGQNFSPSDSSAASAIQSGVPTQANSVATLGQVANPISTIVGNQPTLANKSPVQAGSSSNSSGAQATDTSSSLAFDASTVSTSPELTATIAKAVVQNSKVARAISQTQDIAATLANESSVQTQDGLNPLKAGPSATDDKAGNIQGAPQTSVTGANAAPSGTSSRSQTQNLSSLKQSFSDITSIATNTAEVSAVVTPLTTNPAVAQASAVSTTAQVAGAQPANQTTDNSASISNVATGSGTKSDSEAKLPATKFSDTRTTGVTTSQINGQAIASNASSSGETQSGDQGASQQAPGLQQNVKSKPIVSANESDLATSGSVPTSTTATTGSATVTPTAEVSASTAPTIDKTQLASQVADRIQLLAVTQQKEGVVVHLEPANLGSITLVVKAVASNISATVTASDEHVRAALDQSRDQLGQQLQARGYHLASVSVNSASSASSLGQNSSDNSRSNSNTTSLWQGTSQQQSQQQQSRGSSSFSTRLPGTSAVETASSRTSSSNAKGLDVWI